jgi:hypothetical protein
MPEISLTSFWIEGPDPRGPLGFGVTAFSLEDAWSIIEDAGYALPEEKRQLVFRTVRSVDEVPHRFVREHSGPIVVRGLWCPFGRIGVSS